MVVHCLEAEHCWHSTEQITYGCGWAVSAWGWLCFVWKLNIVWWYSLEQITYKSGRAVSAWAWLCIVWKLNIVWWHSTEQITSRSGRAVSAWAWLCIVWKLNIVWWHSTEQIIYRCSRAVNAWAWLCIVWVSVVWVCVVWFLSAARVVFAGQHCNKNVAFQTGQLPGVLFTLLILSGSHVTKAWHLYVWWFIT